MAQITSSTSTVTPTSGEDWENRPINPQKVLQAWKTTAAINTADLTLYPAIKFVIDYGFKVQDNRNTLTDANSQCWIYAAGDTATRDADFLVADAAIGSVGGGSGTDPNAIHDNVANEINTITTKGTPVSADVLLIEDSAAGWVKKKITVGSLPIGVGTLFTIKSANYSAVNGDYVDMTTGASDKTVTFPASPTLDDLIDVAKADSANGDVICDGNGKNINGEPDATIKKQYESLTFQYNGTEWRIK